MIQQYRAMSNQNIYDVCLMTYGSLAHLFRLMQDNDFGSVNSYPVLGQVFLWEDTLVFDQKVYITNTTAGINYATRQINNGVLNYQVISNGLPTKNPEYVPPYTPPTPPGPTPTPGLGYIYVYAGSAGLSVNGDGQLIYTDSRLVGLTDYAIYADQLPTFLQPETDVSYNSAAGSFTILVPSFEIVAGYKLIVFLDILPPL